jgi:hypothetical protein
VLGSLIRYYFGLQLSMYPRYEVYYGQFRLFRETNPERLLEKAEQFVKRKEDLASQSKLETGSDLAYLKIILR